MVVKFVKTGTEKRARFARPRIPTRVSRYLLDLGMSGNQHKDGRRECLLKTAALMKSGLTGSPTSVSARLKFLDRLNPIAGTLGAATLGP